MKWKELVHAGPSVCGAAREYRQRWSRAFHGEGTIIYRYVAGAVLLTFADLSLRLLCKVPAMVLLVCIRLRARQVRRRRGRQLAQLAYQPVVEKPKPKKRAKPEPAGDEKASAASFFTRLPPEIRYQILVLAFGDRTFHMDLRLRRPFEEVDPDSRRLRDRFSNTSRVHAKISNHLSFPRDGKSDLTWRWFSCVCHRYPPSGTFLPLGRRRNFPRGHCREPDHDECLMGNGTCNFWPGEWPHKCFLGVTGWLSTSRQAYTEGMEVLYRTNTFHIASPILLNGIQDILSPRIVSLISSLELVWNADLVSLDEGFTGVRGTKDYGLQTRRKKRPQPLFPSLLFLHLSFQAPVYGDMDAATGLRWPYRDLNELSEKLHTVTYPAIDRLLDRMAPPTTDVTVSVPKWEWYNHTDLALAEQQGSEKSMLQQADDGGLRCWRQTPGGPTSVTAPKDAVEDGLSSERSREGFWIHVKHEQVKVSPSTNPASRDGRRQDIYGLVPPPGIDSMWLVG